LTIEHSLWISWFKRADMKRHNCPSNMSDKW
jgi:hypothetical protein